jgi:hypothetical protein
MNNAMANTDLAALMGGHREEREKEAPRHSTVASGNYRAAVVT